MVLQHPFKALVPLLGAFVAATFFVSTAALAASPSTTFVAEEAADRDRFGTSVDVAGDRIAVAAPSADLERENVGVVHLFDASSEGVAQVATLAASDAELDDGFGASVAIDGDTALVGAPGVILAELNEGAAYLFEREGDAWTEVAKIRRETTARNDMFGAAVGLDGGLAVVGAPGADAAGADSGTAVVFERQAGGWERATVLAPGAAPAGDRFGSAVAVDGERILVGAGGDTLDGERAGSAHLFERASDGWREVAELRASDGTGGNGFGEAVALAGDLAVVGARFADRDGSEVGRAYVYERTSDGWHEVAVLSAPEPAARDEFGRSVALAGEVVLVGAPRIDDPERDVGGVWTFTRGADGWQRTGRLSPAAQGMYDEFGSAVAAAGSVAVVGTPSDVPEGASESVTGTATVFREVR